MLDPALSGTLQSYRLTEKKGANHATASGSLILCWIHNQENEHVSCVNTANTPAELVVGNITHTEDIASAQKCPLLISITKMTISTLPITKVGTPFGVGSQKLFVRATIGHRFSTSSILRYAGQHGEWDPHEVLELPAQKSWLQRKPHGECVRFAIHKSNYPFADNLIGKSYIHVLEEWIADNGPRVVSLPLTRSQKGELGTFSFEITIHQGKSGPSASATHNAAAEERQRVLMALDRSTKLATLAWQHADEAAKLSKDPASRADLRKAALKAKHQTDHALQRLRFAQALNADDFAQRAKGRLDHIKLTTFRRNKRQAVSRAAALERDAANAAAAAYKAARSLEKRRQYCHVQVVVEVNVRCALGIVWSDVDQDEIEALEAGHSGSARDPELTNHVMDPKGKSAKWFSRKGAVATKQTGANSEVVTTPSSKSDEETELNQLDQKLAALSAGSRSVARSAASAAGVDLRVADVLTGGQAQALGIRVGWRAVAMDDVPIGSKRQLEHDIANLKARLDDENEAVTCRSSVRIAFTKRVVLHEERVRLKNLRRNLMKLRRTNSSIRNSCTMRKKRIQLDPSQPLGITWSQTTQVNSSGSSCNALEVSIEQTSDLHYQKFCSLELCI